MRSLEFPIHLFICTCYWPWNVLFFVLVYLCSPAAVIWVLENSLSGAVKVLCYLHQDRSNLWCIPITWGENLHILRSQFLTCIINIAYPMVTLAILLGSTAFCILRPVAFLNGGVVMQTSRAAHCVSLAKNNLCNGDEKIMPSKLSMITFNPEDSSMHVK